MSFKFAQYPYPKIYVPGQNGSLKEREKKKKNKKKKKLAKFSHSLTHSLMELSSS
jgi:hypothetical protein